MAFILLFAVIWSFAVTPVSFLLLAMICSHCATEMPEVSAFCPACGRSVESESDLPAVASAREALLGAVAYLTFLPAILLLFIPASRSSFFVRFHAWQSIFFTTATAIIALAMRIIFAILSFVPFIGSLFAWLSLGVVFLALVVLWAVLLVKAGQGETYELPWIGRFAAQLSSGKPQ